MAASKLWIFVQAALLMIMLIRPSSSDINCVGNRIQNDNGHCVDAITLALCEQNTALSLMDCKEDLKEAKEVKSNTCPPCHPLETTSDVHITSTENTTPEPCQGTRIMSRVTTPTENTTPEPWQGTRMTSRVTTPTENTTPEPWQGWVVAFCLVTVLVALPSLMGNWWMWRKLQNERKKNGKNDGAEANVVLLQNATRDDDNAVDQSTVDQRPATVANGSAPPLPSETENSVEDGPTDVEPAGQHVIVDVEDAANTLSSVQSGADEDTNLLAAADDVSALESNAPLIATPEADHDSLRNSDCKNGWTYGSKESSECENAVGVEIGRAEENPDHDGKIWNMSNQTVPKTNGWPHAVPLIQPEIPPNVY